MMADQPHRVLGGGDDLKLLLFGGGHKIGNLVIGQVLVIAERPPGGDDAADAFDRAEELLGIGDAGKGEHALSLDIRDIDGPDRRLEHRLAGPAGDADKRVGGVARADFQQRGGEFELQPSRRAHRPGRHDIAIADAAHGVDHHQCIVEMQFRALEAVVHDDQVAALGDQPSCAFDALAGDDGQRMMRDQQRLVADIFGAVVGGVDHGRAVHAAAITTAEDTRLQPPGLGGLGKRDNGGRLAGAADGKIADADDRHRHLLPLGLAHVAAGDRAVDPGGRRQQPGLQTGFFPPERRRFRYHAPHLRSLSGLKGLLGAFPAGELHLGSPRKAAENRFCHMSAQNAKS